MAALAQCYSDVSSRYQGEDGLKLIQQLSLAKNSKVLDLGCGTGYLSSVLAERVGPGGKVVGVDPDKERIRLAREKYGGVGNLVFVEGSGEEFPEGPHDLVFSTHVFHWIKNKEPVFRKVFRELAVGGCMAILAVEDAPPIGYQLAKLANVEISSTHHFASCEEYVDIAVRCGFVVDVKLAMPMKYSFPNFDVFLDWVTASTGGHFDRDSVEPTSLVDFKKPFGDGVVEFETPTVILVFRKP